MYGGCNIFAQMSEAIWKAVRKVQEHCLNVPDFAQLRVAPSPTTVHYRRGGSEKWQSYIVGELPPLLHC